MVSDERQAEDRRQQRIAEALGRLALLDDFKVFVNEVLVEGLLEQHAKNDELEGDGIVLARGQGQARTYREILKQVANAPGLAKVLQIKARQTERVRAESARTVRQGDGRGAY